MTLPVARPASRPVFLLLSLWSTLAAAFLLLLLDGCSRPSPSKARSKDSSAAGAKASTAAAASPASSLPSAAITTPDPAAASRPVPFRNENHLLADTSPRRTEACVECHQDIVDAWRPSHHANANRLLTPLLDDPAFAARVHPGYNLAPSTFSKDGDSYTISTQGPSGQTEAFTPDMAFGYDPLVQYLIPFPGGRWQSTQIAWDPAKKEWFDVYGDERHAGEWGHWTGRGMNWNSQCAWCHMTGFEKRYDPPSDTYASRWVEQAISCSQCHTAMEDHVRRAAAPGYQSPPEPQFPRPLAMETCAGCHSRRGEITGAFQPGDRYLDHFRLQLPDRPGLYYPDGQIRDEVYVYGSLRMSKMGHAGVTCFDCHDPHTATLKHPVENNALCQTCHAAPGQNNAPIIDPLAHSHHQPDSTGNRCVECHMPHTVYMARDPRRDHGFHIPDPLLTRELGIPNACSTCHQDQTLDWNIEWTDKWYGDKMNRPERARTRAVARAYANDPAAAPDLLAALAAEKIGYWQATLLRLLAPYAPDPAVPPVARTYLSHEDPLVRAAAGFLLGQTPDSRDPARRLLFDPVRSVRLEAAEIFQDDLEPGERPYQELLHYLTFSSDQPGGATGLGIFHSRQNNLAESVRWFERALLYDPNSPGIRENLALALHALGRLPQAIAQFLEARRLAPDNPHTAYSLALLYAEQGDITASLRQLEDAVALDPAFSRAWYNLGLAQAQSGRLLSALSSLQKAESLEPANPDYPYALATLFLQARQPAQARAALLRSLQLNPAYIPALQLLQQLEANPAPNP